MPLVELAYNNSFQSTIGMVPYEALYDRPCRSPLCWVKAGESTIVRRHVDNSTRKTLLLGQELIEETTDKIALLRQQLRAAQDMQKKYADLYRRTIEFKGGHHVFTRYPPIDDYRKHASWLHDS